MNRSNMAGMLLVAVTVATPIRAQAPAKQTANELLAPQVGMMMMSGMMQSGQPGQTMPGPMMRQPPPQPGN